MNTKLTYPILLLLILLGGCKKATEPQQASTINRLKEMHWPTFGHTAQLSYHTDGTLDEINYQRKQILEKRSFGHGWNGLVYITSTQSLAFNSFDYDPNTHQVAKMQRIIGDAQTARVYQELSFHYNNFSQLSTVKFFNVNAAGASLRSTFNYAYISTLPAEISITDQAGQQRLIKIDQYSDEFDFDPLWFMEMEVGTLTPLYNLPILQHLANRHRLPSAFKIYKIENGNQILEKEYVITYAISNRRLNKQVTWVKDHIESTSTTAEVIFKY